MRDIEKKRAYMREYMKSYRYPDADQHRTYMREYTKKQYWAKPGERKKRLERFKTWAKKNADSLSESRRSYRDKNKSRLAALNASHKKKNRAYYSACEMKRHATKLHATPKWASGFFISEAYDLAKLRSKATGFKWQVDHIVPLRSPIVSGLHVEYNLQVIPALQNQKKSNRIWPDMPN